MSITYAISYRFGLPAPMPVLGVPPVPTPEPAPVDPPSIAATYPEPNAPRVPGEKIECGAPLLGRRIDDLIRLYETDPDSPRKKLQYSTRCNYDSLCDRLSHEHGYEYLEELDARVLLGLYERWAAPDEEDGKPKAYMAHGLMQMVRILVNFGATFGRDPDCIRLAATLHNMRFETGKPRTVTLKVEWIIRIRQRAHALGLHSIALAQSIGLGCTFRQKDCIGALLPLSEKGRATYVYGDKKYHAGILWEEIDDNLILRHVTNKTQAPATINLTLEPMIVEELQFAYPGCITFVEVVDPDTNEITTETIIRRDLLPARGPVIICETTQKPWTAVGFRRMWRRIADECGVPKSVRQMDTRAEAVTEAIRSGASLDDARKAAKHANASMTARYSRGDEEAVEKVMKLRAASRIAGAQQ